MAESNNPAKVLVHLNNKEHVRLLCLSSHQFYSSVGSIFMKRLFS